VRRSISITVAPEDAGQRLDTYLQRRLRAFSRARIQEMIADDLTQKQLKASSLVRAGLVLELSREEHEEPRPPLLRVIHEDDAVLVIDKPGDLAVHPAGRYYRYTVTGALTATYANRPDPAHRLDRETSGILICGRGRAATAALKADFAAGRIQKSYLAIVDGWPPRPAFDVSLPLQLGTGRVRVRMEVGSGKAAVTAPAMLAEDRSPAPDPRASRGGETPSGWGQDLWTRRDHLHPLH